MDLHIPIYREREVPHKKKKKKRRRRKQRVECVDEKFKKKKKMLIFYFLSIMISFLTTFVVGLYHNLYSYP